MEGELPKASSDAAPPSGEAAPATGGDNATAQLGEDAAQVEGPAKSKEELVELARSNVQLAEKFLSVQNSSEAVDAFAEALGLYKEAFGDTESNIETAPVYLKFGVTLMRLAERNMEKALNDVMMDAMRQRANAEGGEAKKLGTAEIEEHAQEHLDDLDDAWEALEVARLTYETANDVAGMSEARMALGDLCIILEDWEGADREFSASAELRQKTVGDSRLTVESFFLAGLAKESLGAAHRDAALDAFKTARDIMARLVDARLAASAAEPELAELREILDSLNDKIVRFPLEGADAGEARGAGDDEDDDEDDASGAGDIVVDDEDAEPAAPEEPGKRAPAEDAVDDNQSAAKRAKPDEQ